MGDCNKPSADWPATCLEGNRRDCNISGNQTSGKKGGVQCVMMVVYILHIICLSNKRNLSLTAYSWLSAYIYILCPEILM